MKLKKIGFFSELPYGDPLGGSLKDFIGKIDKTVLEKVALYLKSGRCLVAAPGIARDALSSDRKIIGSIAILTDGIYAWPRDMVYYVENYNISVPDNFLTHMKNRNWRVVAVDLTNLEL